MDRSAIEQLQMHGQDIPWLLAHWATHKPDHPALVWDPAGRRGSVLDLGGAARRHAGPGRGPARPRHRGGRQGAHPRRELAGGAPRLAGLRDRRRGGGHHQHALGRERDRLLRRAHRLRGGHRRRRLRRRGRRGGPQARVDRGDPRRRRRRGPGRRRRQARPHPVRRARRAMPRAWTGPADRAAAAVRHHVHVGHDEPPQGGRAHPRQRGVGQPHRPPQHRPRHRRPLPDLPPALPRRTRRAGRSSRCSASAPRRC